MIGYPNKYESSLHDFGHLATFSETTVRSRDFRSGKALFSSVSGFCRPATRWRITKSGQEPDLTANDTRTGQSR
jgi:hypothetical protein